jgi:hypothetical protein
MSDRLSETPESQLLQKKIRQICGEYGMGFNGEKLNY